MAGLSVRESASVPRAPLPTLALGVLRLHGVRIVQPIDLADDQIETACASLSQTWRPNPSQDPQPSTREPEFVVHLQSCHGRSTNGSATDDAQTVAGPCEMVLPNINARIEQRHGFTRFRVDRRSEVAFVPIACRATQPKILAAGRATQRTRLDVFQLQRHRQELLRNQAVATPLSCVAFHLPSQ